jgi:hypothetical protein
MHANTTGRQTSASPEVDAGTGAAAPECSPQFYPGALAAACELMAIGFTPEDMDLWTLLSHREEIKAAMERIAPDPAWRATASPEDIEADAVLRAELAELSRSLGLTPRKPAELDVARAILRTAEESR